MRLKKRIYDRADASRQNGVLVFVTGRVMVRSSGGQDTAEVTRKVGGLVIDSERSERSSSSSIARIARR